MQNSNEPNQDMQPEQKDAKKKSAWKSGSPEDTTGKQNAQPYSQDTRQGNPNKAMGNAANRENESPRNNR
jgi:hypothetical protein